MHATAGSLTFLLVVGACSGGGAPPTPPRKAEAELAPQRQACAFRAGAMAADTLGRELPVGRDLPVEHVVLLMQENRSFDHYLGELSRRGVPEVDGASTTASNPDGRGVPVTRYHEDKYCNDDVSHSWSRSHDQYNGGAQDGFVTSSGSRGRLAMGYYDEDDLPFYYGLARAFSIGDRFFCSLLGPTLPNRMFLLSGSSFGLTVNTLPPPNAPNIFESLSTKGIDWKVYGQMTPTAAIYAVTTSKNIDRYVSLDDFLRDAAAGTLPPFSFVEPRYLGGGAERNDEHPPGNVQLGQQFVSQVVHAVMQSPLWPKTVLFITYDEHGGFYDHVPPPPACPPGGVVSSFSDGTVSLSEFNRLGFRVPFYVVSPFAKRGFVTHETYDHTSILRFVEALFELPALSDRTANATPPYDVFDFKSPPNLTLPTLPEATVDMTQLADCMSRYPSSDRGF